MSGMPLSAPALELSDDQRACLLGLARSPSLPHRMVVQAQGLIDAADGVANEEIARRYCTTPNAVRRWRTKFESTGVEGVGKVAKGRGRKSWLPDGTVEAVITDTRTTVPDDGSTRWSTRTLAEKHGIGKDSVARIWRENRLKPWKVDGFKLSTDPEFEAKVVDVVGLYLNPPERAVVFSFDEKTQVQALDRTQASLPMKPGRGKTMTHDYKRHGVTDLFAAMNIATGEVIYDTRKTHTGADVLAFFKSIDRQVKKSLEIHVVLDNLSAHKSPEVKTWLADPKRARWHLHFTPTSSSWLNLVECWFSILTRKRLLNSAFNSLDALIDAIEVWAKHWNDNPTPFIWKRHAKEIIESAQRGRATLNHVTKIATDH
jgi:transposase